MRVKPSRLIQHMVTRNSHKMASLSWMTVFVFFIYILNGPVSGKLDKVTNSTFKPTHQWQRIREGQAVPPGLHIRINFQTGEKEAKLPDIENGDNNKKSLITVDQNENTDKKNEDEENLDPEKLKKLLKTMKKADDSFTGDSIKRKFRSYEELKEDFNKLNLQTESDVKILIERFKKFNFVKVKGANNKSSDWSENDVLTTLLVLEYLVHEYDHAQEFARLNGFSDVVYKSLNSSNSEIRSEALRLLGSATQSNPEVQIAALDSGSINFLLKILTFDEDVKVRSRSLFALSCLIRRFPAAQQKLITHGGLTAFAKVFDEEKQNLLKLQIKIITLIHDLLFERKDTKMNILEEESRNQTDSKIETLRERLRQYEKMDLEKKLVEQEWCKRISDWFSKQNHIKDLNKNSNSDITLESVNLDSHDIIEKVVDTLYILSDICKSQFQSDSNFVNLLLSLRKVYSELALAESKRDDDDSNQFYTSLSNVLKMLTDKIKGANSRDEL